MSPIIANSAAMETYTSYDLAWFGPIVFPLSFSIPTIFYVFSTYYRTGIKSAADIVSFGIVACEAMFAFFCWAQCIANYTNRDFQGGIGACNFQAIYATIYLFTSVMLVGLAAATTMLAISPRAATLSTFVVWGLGICTAFLPYMGAGQYRFPKDFCMCDLQQEVFATLWLVAWATSLLLLLFSIAAPQLQGPVPLPCCCQQAVRSRMVGMARVLAFIAFFSTPTIIDFIYIGGGSQPGAIYGALAIILHFQQIGNPLLYGLLWRSFHNEALGALSADNEGKLDPLPVPTEDASKSGEV